MAHKQYCNIVIIHSSCYYQPYYFKVWRAIITATQRSTQLIDSHRTDHNEIVNSATFRIYFDCSHGISKIDLEANPKAFNIPLKINVSRPPKCRRRQRSAEVPSSHGRTLNWLALHVALNPQLPSIQRNLSGKREEDRGGSRRPKGNAAVWHRPPLLVGPANGAQRAELPDPGI